MALSVRAPSQYMCGPVPSATALANATRSPAHAHVTLPFPSSCALRGKAFTQSRIDLEPSSSLMLVVGDDAVVSVEAAAVVVAPVAVSAAPVAAMFEAVTPRLLVSVVK